MRKKVSLLIVSIMLFTLLCGCWDNVEIDSKCFVSTIGIDPGEDIEECEKLKEIKEDDPFAERQVKKLKITYGYPDMSQLGPGKPAVADSKTIKTEAYSMQDGVSKATAKSSREIYLGHTKLLLLSSDVMSHGEVVKEIIDYLQREPSLNRMMKVVIVEGEAEKFIKFKPEMEKNIEFYIDGLMNNTRRNAAVFTVTLNEMLILLSENGNALIPRLVLKDEELSLEGVAVIKDYKIKGALTPLEAADLAIIRGNIKTATKVIYSDGHPIDFVLDGITRKIELDSSNKKNLKFNINIDVEGQIKGYYLDKEKDLISEINQIENSIDKSLSSECTIIAESIQKNMGIEPFELQEYIRKFKPSLWREIEDKWEEVYKNSSIKVNVKSKIRRIGVID